jgi:hypothetical protein
MEKLQIEKELVPILEGCSKFGRNLILLFTFILYVAYSKIFLFILYGFFTYPIAILFYLHGADKIVFLGAAVIHFSTLELICFLWPERQKDMADLKLEILLILKSKKK